ncbi:MAG: hypothetical protein JW720_14680 [Sedimentisphaerales bacterium]|nr:hypothetical protein [Sedimentisphaerales bacterium]
MQTKKEYFSWFVILIMAAISFSTVGQALAGSEAKERELISVLKSDAAKGEKAIACKQLAIYGSDDAVGALAPLLADKELSSWARIALEAIPGPAVDAALREAVGKLEGRLLVGVINSIGVRRDAGSVGGLAARLDDTNVSVASAAAVALGHIGGDQAAKALTPLLVDAPAGVRSAAAEGCILCAEWYLANGKTAEAVKLYDTIRKADLPNQRHLEAIRGAILARGTSGVPLLIEQLRSEDKEKLGIGLRTARELPGREVTEALAAELARLDADRRVLLLLALADRKDSAVLGIVQKAAQGDPKGLRVTAIDILIRLGDVSCVPVLLDAAIEDDTKLAQAATETLVRLAGKDVDADLLSRLPQAQGKLLVVLLEVAGQRQISEAVAAVASSLANSDAAVRMAAVQTIGILGQEDQADDLVRLIQKTTSDKERAGIEKALLAISGRCGAKCIPHLRPLTASSDNALHMIGLHALAIVGGPDALGAVKSAIEGSEPAVQDEAVRILSTWPNNWPEDTEAGQLLLKLATSAKKMTHQVLGLRGYLQYVRGSKNLSSEQKVSRIKDVRSHITRPEEERQAIAVLAEAPSTGALDLLTTLSADAAVAEEAYSAMVRIAGRNVSGVSDEQRRQVLQTVAEKSGNNGTRERARKALSEIR